MNVLEAKSLLDKSSRPEDIEYERACNAIRAVSTGRHSPADIRAALAIVKLGCGLKCDDQLTRALAVRALSETVGEDVSIGGTPEKVVEDVVEWALAKLDEVIQDQQGTTTIIDLSQVVTVLWNLTDSERVKLDRERTDRVLDYLSRLFCDKDNGFVLHPHAPTTCMTAVYLANRMVDRFLDIEQDDPEIQEKLSRVKQKLSASLEFVKAAWIGDVGGFGVDPDAAKRGSANMIHTFFAVSLLWRCGRNNEIDGLKPKVAQFIKECRVSERPDSLYAFSNTEEARAMGSAYATRLAIQLNEKLTKLPDSSGYLENAARAAIQLNERLTELPLIGILTSRTAPTINRILAANFPPEVADESVAPISVASLETLARAGGYLGATPAKPAAEPAEEPPSPDSVP
jgi:hypothetical protein